MRNFLDVLFAVFMTENMFFSLKKEKARELTHKADCDGTFCGKDCISCKDNMLK